MIMGFFEIHKQIERDLALLSDWAMFYLGTDHSKTYRGWGRGGEVKKNIRAREN